MIKYIILLLCITSSFGCDRVRKGETYRLNSQKYGESGHIITVTDGGQNAILISIFKWLENEGFKAFDTKRTYWINHGARIRISLASTDNVLIRFSAIGGTRSLRISEQAESHFIDFLSKQPWTWSIEK
jgi:hypothetical protein